MLLMIATASGANAARATPTAADLNAPLAFSVSAGSPPAIVYRTAPMVANSVATANRIPTSQAVALPMIALRCSVGSTGAGTGAAEAAAAGNSATVSAPAVNVITAAPPISALMMRFIAVAPFEAHAPLAGVRRRIGGEQGDHPRVGRRGSRSPFPALRLGACVTASSRSAHPRAIRAQPVRSGEPASGKGAGVSSTMTHRPAHT